MKFFFEFGLADHKMFKDIQILAMAVIVFGGGAPCEQFW